MCHIGSNYAKQRRSLINIKETDMPRKLEEYKTLPPTKSWLHCVATEEFVDSASHMAVFDQEIVKGCSK